MTLSGLAIPSGARLREFVIDRVLGIGGFGITYLARDMTLHRFVAIKEYMPQAWGIRVEGTRIEPKSIADTDDYQWGLRQFIKEARALTRLSHPQIVRVHRVIETQGTAYLVMEYVEGVSLAATLNARGRLSERWVRSLFESLADGLAAVHAAGLLHRDIKPANILVRRDRTPILIDFGAAQKQVGERSGALRTILTPGYAPLEQYPSTGRTTRREGPWTDIYSLSAVGYAALTGRTPADAIDRASQAHDVCAELSDAQPVSLALSTAIREGMKVDATERPQSVAEWHSLLKGDPRERREHTRRSDGAIDKDLSAPGRQLRPQRAYHVGRHPRSDIVVDHCTVSGRHASVTWSADDRIEIRDLESTNGTHIWHGGRWKLVRRALLHPHHRIRLGSCEIAASRLASLCRLLDEDTGSAGT